MGHDFPDQIDDYKLIIHCGACMTNRKTVQSQINISKDINIFMINYRIFSAYMEDLLERSISIFGITINEK